MLELLGEGSQGRVYKALRFDRKSGLQQMVAIKILHSKTAVDLWRQEFHSLSRVRSPFCVQVLSFERIGRRPALVLEFVEGVSLARLGQACCLDSDDVGEIVAQIEFGLKDLHHQGVLHGDLSPQNVLMDTRGKVRLVDFGLANCTSLRLTPQFAAPERLRGEPACEAGDLYALGRVERFLSGDQLNRSSYLNLNPQQRTYQDLSPCPQRQKALAAKVERFWLLQKQSMAACTRSEALHRPRTWLSKAGVVAGITAILPLVLPSASHSSHAVPQGMLRVRTSKWLYLSLNGHSLGYAPLTLPVEAETIQHLQWNSKDGHGTKDILVKNMQTLTLADSDFSH